MPSGRIGLLACVVAVTPGCRQLFGIDDTSVAGGDGPVAAADAPPGTPDATIADAAPPDATPDAMAFSPALCPASYDRMITSVPGSRYRRIATSNPLAVHHADCNDDAPGWTHLIVLDSDNEGTTAAGFTPQAQKYVGAVQAPGAIDVDADWYRFTGEPINTPWSPQGPGPQPDDAGDGLEKGEESFAIIVSLGAYIDVTGGFAYEAICECDGRPIDPLVAQMIAAAIP